MGHHKGRRNRQNIVPSADRERNGPVSVVSFRELQKPQRWNVNGDRQGSAIAGLVVSRQVCAAGAHRASLLDVARAAQEGVGRVHSPSREPQKPRE
ncbi:hypothetical protein CERSUDRAFT_101425 [Gelatoporia subvermispora B]|uniref:Uncharacterized protein n=1 Tax=Ceriporiopsis subvermispora (strain B) TaxID=914234 RepID=M2QEG0_CERS8|nr:hypothetical protein CERSUDRAFT_101425 [Gelatoporia subvermispora B]